MGQQINTVIENCIVPVFCMDEAGRRLNKAMAENRNASAFSQIFYTNAWFCLLAGTGLAITTQMVGLTANGLAWVGDRVRYSSLPIAQRGYPQRVALALQRSGYLQSSAGFNGTLGMAKVLGYGAVCFFGVALLAGVVSSFTDR